MCSRPDFPVECMAIPFLAGLALCIVNRLVVLACLHSIVNKWTGAPTNPQLVTRKSTDTLSTARPTDRPMLLCTRFSTYRRVEWREHRLRGQHSHKDSSGSNGRISMANTNCFVFGGQCLPNIGQTCKQQSRAVSARYISPEPIDQGAFWCAQRLCK